MKNPQTLNVLGNHEFPHRFIVKLAYIVADTCGCSANFIINRNSKNMIELIRNYHIDPNENVKNALQMEADLGYKRVRFPDIAIKYAAMCILYPKEAVNCLEWAEQHASSFMRVKELKNMKERLSLAILEEFTDLELLLMKVG